ncbi:PepSY domain-containing protein [Nostoc sp.]|uniref:PepSY domain-containing protein n=1 Tax=Nostoc sp. TaxID=1180 RepID=UPI003FA54803
MRNKIPDIFDISGICLGRRHRTEVQSIHEGRCLATKKRLRILNSFGPLHFGTFWGLPSRIFYVFVGLAPLILFITGFVMW